MAKVALVVVDMLNDFLDPRGALYVGPPGREIIPFVARKIEEVRQAGGAVIFVCDAHAPEDQEFRKFPPHAVKGTWGADLIPELPFQEGDVRVDKTRFNALHGTGLHDLLRHLGVDTVEVVGVCTSICVLFTAIALSDHGYTVRVWKDGVADFDPEAHDFTLRHLTKLGVEVR